MLKVEDILAIITAVDQSGISRFELEQEATKLVLVKGDSQAAPAKEQSATAASLNQAAVHTAASVPAALPALPAEQAPAAEQAELYSLPAPMIGTFYAAPEPGAAPFVAVGQKVEAGTIVCVLEAMKLFNEIEAGIAGEVTEVLVKDGQFVEYGQPLFVIKKL